MTRQKFPELGRRLHEEQVRLALTTQQMAHAANCSTSKINDIKCGRHGMSAGMLASQAPLGIDVLYVLLGQRGAA